jgi:prevent-host-death family protein
MEYTVQPVNMLEAKSNLSRLVAAIESGQEHEIVLSRNGRPVARLVPIAQEGQVITLGVAKGQFELAEDIDRHNDEVAALFGAAQ